MSDYGDNNVRNRAEAAVYAAIDGLNEMLPQAHMLKKSPETALLGRMGKLDSAGFINLIVLLEERCEEQFGIAISLSNDAPGSEENPFENIATLIDHIERLVKVSLRLTSDRLV